MVNKKTCPLGPGRRAIDESMKERRRRDLLDAALRLLERQPYETLTMSAVAAAAGVAKGTTYLYFPTREALFLALLAEHYAAWFDDLDACLKGDVPAVEAWVGWVVTELAARPMFLRLAALLHVVLEANVPVADALAFKRALAARVVASGGMLECTLGLAAGLGARLLLWLQAVVPGLAQMATPPPALHQALRGDAALAGFLVDFSTELRALLLALIRGLDAAKETHP